MYPDLGAGRSISPGLKNAHKDARKLTVQSGVTTAQFSILAISGLASAEIPEVVLADNTTLAKASGPLYIQLSKAQQTGGTYGFRVGGIEGLPFGVIPNANTSGSAIGAPVYLDAAGGWTLTKPTSNFIRVIGTVIKVSTTVGEIAFSGLVLGMPAGRHVSPVIGVKKAVTASATAVFSTSDLGGNYDGSPVAVSMTTDGTKYVLGYAWNGSGQLTVTLSAAATGSVSVLIAPWGD